MTVLNRQIIKENDERGTTRLRLTYDIGNAMSLAKDVNDDGGGRSENGEMVAMGFIPPEMWGFDPWLIQARKAQRAGDMGEYTRMLKKFFEVHPQFAVMFKKKYY